MSILPYVKYNGDYAQNYIFSNLMSSLNESIKIRVGFKFIDICFFVI